MEKLEERALAAHKAREYKECMELCETLMENNNQIGYALAGEMFYMGSLGFQDMEKSFELCKKAADLGHCFAMFRTANFYHLGLGVEKNVEKAVEYYIPAAEQGEKDSIFRLGEFYYGYYGIQYRNIDLAIKYYEMSSHKFNHEKAQFELGKIYFSGELVPQDTIKAIKYLELCKETYTKACLLIADCYENAIGVEQDLKKAYENLKLVEEEYGEYLDSKFVPSEYKEGIARLQQEKYKEFE